MPLIRAIQRFFQRRMEVDYSSAEYGDAIRTEYGIDLGGAGSYGRGDGMSWAAVMVVTAPMILLLVLIGAAYEVIVHLGGRRLPAALDWLIATAAVTMVVGVGIWWVLGRF